MRERPRLDDEANVRMATANIVVRYSIIAGAWHRGEHGYFQPDQGRDAEYAAGTGTAAACGTPDEVPRPGPVEHFLLASIRAYARPQSCVLGPDCRFEP